MTDLQKSGWALVSKSSSGSSGVTHHSNGTPHGQATGEGWQAGA